jgi:hypothetical protein
VEVTITVAPVQTRCGVAAFLAPVLASVLASVLAIALAGAVLSATALPAVAAPGAAPSTAALAAASTTASTTASPAASPTPKITLVKGRNPKNAAPSLSLKATGKASASSGVSNPVVRDFILAIVGAAVFLALGIAGLFATRRPRGADAASPVNPAGLHRRRHGR